MLLSKNRLAGACFPYGVIFLTALVIAGCSSTGTSTPPVSRTTPKITWAVPASVVYGTALSSAQLDASSGGVAGTPITAPPAA